MSGRRIVVPARRGALPPDPGPAARFTRAFTRTFAVRNNVALFHVPRPGIWSFPAHTIWLAHDGTVVRRFSDN